MLMVDRTTTHAVNSTHSHVERTCAVCGDGIKAGAGRYRFGEREYHPLCFKFWLTAPLTGEDEATTGSRKLRWRC
jgi:hypothetical protein